MSELSRRGFLVASAATLAGGTHAQASAATLNMAELAKKATAEGEVMYYASTNPVLSQRLADLFNKSYPGIKVNIVRLASGPLARRYASEAEGGDVVADILQMGDLLTIEEGVSKGWFTRIDDLPSHQAWPAGFKDAHSATVSLFPDTITYNTNLVKGADIPTSWQSVLDDKWRGKILLGDPRNSPSLLEWCMLMNDTYGPEYLKKLAAQKPRIVASTLPGTQMIAAGEAALLLPNLRMVSYSLIEKKAPLDDVTPSPDSGLESILAISTKAKHPNAARLLSNFILSRDGQEVLSKNTAASPLPNIAGALPLPKGFRRAKVKEAMARGPQFLQLLNLG
jgi:iron(III) transport system substrate-binding protein